MRWSRCTVPWSLSRLENQRNVLVRVIVVNEIRSCCLCTTLTRFVFPTPFFHLQTHFTDSLQFANEPVETWNVSSYQERYWSQSFILRILVHGGC